MQRKWDSTFPWLSLFSHLLIFSTLWQAAGVISASASAWQTILVHWLLLGRSERSTAKSTLRDTGNQGESSIRTNDNHLTTTINRVVVNRELLGPSLCIYEGPFHAELEPERWWKCSPFSAESHPSTSWFSSILEEPCSKDTSKSRSMQEESAKPEAVWCLPWPATFKCKFLWSTHSPRAPVGPASLRFQGVY